MPESGRLLPISLWSTTDYKDLYDELQLTTANCMLDYAREPGFAEESMRTYIEKCKVEHRKATNFSKVKEWFSYKLK